MRCKVGDICIVINDIESPQNNGKRVEIESKARSEDHPFDWDCTPIDRLLFEDGPLTSLDIGEALYRDCELIPIREPGDDSTDESKAYLPPVPTLMKETA